MPRSLADIVMRAQLAVNPGLTIFPDHRHLAESLQILGGNYEDASML
jgi:hypothetical protein